MNHRIRVLGIAPYEGMKTLMSSVVADYPQIDLTLFVGDMEQGLEIARNFGFTKILAVCDEDNFPSEKVILKNGGVLENTRYDAEENVNVKRYWIAL